MSANIAAANGKSSAGIAAASPRMHDGRIHSLTGLRWVAALWVFGVHFIGLQLASPYTPYGKPVPPLPATERWMNIIFGSGGIAVSCFFILSGFILTWSSRPGDSATAFWRRRFATIYPVYALTTVIGIVVVLILFGETPDWKVGLTQLFMVQAWVPQQFFYLNFNAVTWSLSCEAFFYLCFPMLIILLRRATTRALRLTAVGCFAFSLIMPYLASHNFTTKYQSFQFVPVTSFGGQFANWFTYYFPVTRLAEFLLGITIAVLFQRGKWIGPRVPLAIAITVGGFVLNHYLPPLVQLEAGMMIPFALLIPALARADLEGTWSPLRWRPLVWLGTISYCLYSVHYLLLTLTGSYLRLWLWKLHLVSSPVAGLPSWVDVLFFFIYLGVATLVAWLTYRFVERPMFRLLRPKSRSTDKPTSQEIPAPVPDGVVSSTT